MSESNLPRAARLAAALLLIALPMTAHATISPEAAKVIDRYLVVAGGRAAILAEYTSHTKDTVSAFGFTGTIDAWTQRPDHVASVTALGPFTLKDGFDGATAWRIDQNGKLTQRDGKDLENEKGQAWFENDRWLEADQGGGAITVKSVGSDSLGNYTVLEITPPVGRPHDLWFNDESGLLDRIVVKNDAQTLVTRLTDYRRDQGRMRPHKQIGTVVDMPANTILITVDSLWVNPVIDPVVFTMPAAAATNDAKFIPGGTTATLPIRYGERHVWLKVSVNGGPPEDFILDSGASVSLLDSAWAAAHGITGEGKMQAVGAGATGGVAFTHVHSLKVAGPDGHGVELTDQKIAVLALNRFIAPFFWRDAAGVLGYDFISRFADRIDYDNSTLTLYDAKTFKYDGKGTGMPITMAGSIPVVKAKIDDTYEGDFRLDVGSGSTVDLHSPFVKQHALATKVGKTIEIMNGGFGGTFTSHLGRMKKMQIGPYAWNEPLVILSGAESGGLASQDYAGNIGNEVLDRFVITLDYEHRMLYLEPGRRFAKRDKFSRAGVELARFGDTIQALQVLPGSAAAAAGVKEGDSVTSLDGKAILTYAPDQLNDMFQNEPAGTKHTLEVLRDGKKMSLTLTLKVLI
ncbi:MAG: aspartyl protease family protein [Candidatus Eisenbacteria bacterium]|uniref:Aspartyl protease family protein n=1 Tax=Eiseniibacteriota bacterium TaxID=2212470 RepID=A0A9D6LC56_UNCEI|nr:aspartyl protease family protein [Candidatus Eisenbacteria bacterium]MBI3539999.1 aspartyl protease family protein [Candidatus Eisenbacteria bacterium]